MVDKDRHRAALERILLLVVLLNEDMTSSLARDGVSTSRAPVLWHLRQHGPATQRQLADALKVSARTITGLVDGLEATGFVTRQPHPTDRRATLVTFTERGAGTVEAWARAQTDFADLLFGQMPADRFACFVAGLDDILARLGEQGLAHRPGEEDR